MARKKSGTKSTAESHDDSKNSFTFGQLLSAIGDSDYLRMIAQKQRDKGTGTTPNTVEFLNLKSAQHFENEAAEHRKRIPKSSGLHRLKTICEVEQVPFTESSLKMLSGRFCIRKNILPEQINDLPVDQVAEMLWNDSGESFTNSSAVTNSDEPKSAQSPHRAPLRFQSAFWAYRHAEQNADDSLTDSEAYNWLKEYGGPDGYELPSKETFIRYLRAARKAINELKQME